MEMGHEVLPIVRDTPVLAGRLRHRPVPADGRASCARCSTPGFAGVQNFPTVGLIDGTFRANLEETGMGYGLEVDMIREARDARAADVRRTCSTPSDAVAMTEAGADVLVPHMGLTTKGTIGAHTAQDARRVRRARSRRCATPPCAVNPDVIVLCHGGPLAEPEDAQYVLDRTEGIVGFFGASSMERLPTEVAMTENMRRFKALARAEESPCRPSSSTPPSLPTMTFDWGVIKPLVAGDNTDGTAVSLMHVVLLPGQGHERHNHPDADEILYILAGAGDQMVDDGDTFAGPPRPHGVHPEGRVPLDDQHGLRADGDARDLRARPAPRRC